MRSPPPLCSPRRGRSPSIAQGSALGNDCRQWRFALKGQKNGCCIIKLSVALTGRFPPWFALPKAPLRLPWAMCELPLRGASLDILGLVWLVIKNLQNQFYTNFIINFLIISREAIKIQSHRKVAKFPCVPWLAMHKKRGCQLATSLLIFCWEY